ncbi:MAG: TIGR04255 family protein [Clostridiales bacterium]|nr:TIGR04255 family protein [Clostridiales bacterium]
MLLSEHERCIYSRSPLHEVICQLRFPAILSIGTKEPVDFQEAIRADFPRYAVKQDILSPKIAGIGTTHPTVERQDPVTNYNFISADGTWKINLTNRFISLSTLHYTRWEDFARQLDKPLGHFIRLYQPAFFERIGLRYLNVISRQKLELPDCSWAELLQSPYLGPLSQPDVAEANLSKCALDAEMRLDSSCHVRIHAGPGRMQRNTPGIPDDPEVKFILDLDLFMGGSIAGSLVPGALETLHGHSTRLFQGAITDTLRDALK